VVDWRGKLDSREHQGSSFEFCPSPSQTNLHNTFEYPLQIVVSEICHRSVNQRRSERHNYLWRSYSNRSSMLARDWSNLEESS